MQSLIPNPLHPAVVHLPIAFAVILPGAVSLPGPPTHFDGLVF